MSLLQSLVDHTEGRLSQMTPATAITPGKAWQVELAEAMFGARSAVGPFCSEHMPLITDALIRANQKFGNDLDRTDFLVLALATIGAENASLKPQDEGVQYKGPANNSAYEPFDIYEPYDKEKVRLAREKAEKEHPDRHPVRVPKGGMPAADNTDLGDGARYKGRGWVQLTHRLSYRRAGDALHLDLETNPDQAGAQYAENCAQILAWRVGTGGRTHSAYRQICDDLAHNRTTALRMMVNGGTNGLDNFVRAYWAGRQFFRRGYYLRVMRMGLKACL
jgi:predicted chitinase